jgi:hypothetical protein
MGVVLTEEYYVTVKSEKLPGTVPDAKDKVSSKPMSL